MTGLFATVLAAAGVALFSNGDFEKGAVGWKLPDKLWSVVDGAGVKGSKAIVVDIPPGSNLNYVVSEMFPVEPGTVYRFEVSMKNDSFTCRYGRIGASFEALDANFHEVGGCGGTLQDDNEVGRDGWCRFAGRSRPLPKTAAWGRFAIWAPAHGCVGRIRYDDFKLEQVASKPGVKAVHTSAYRDTATGGKLRLAAEYFANPLRYPDADLRGAFVFSGNGKTLRVPDERLGDESAEAMASLDTLPIGDYRLSFVVETKGGETLGEKTIPFHLVAKLPKRKVVIDEHHRTLVDGRPFFPLGMYWTRINEPQLQVYTNGPFNCLMAYKSPSREEMDLAWKYGLRVIYASQGLYAAFVGKSEKKRAYLDQRLALKDHPALLAWYVCDELKAELVPELVERNLAFRAADPDHPTWQVLNYPDRAREFMDGADAVGCDPYPISGHHDGTSAPISIASSSPEKVSQETYGMRPMWTVPQMFNWGWYRKEIYDKPIVRMPTRDEMANMAWQAVAAGSNGLVFYSFMDVMDKEKDAKKREVYWQDMLSVVREVKRWETVLLSDPSDLTVASAPADKLVVRVWKCQGEDVALAVNRKENETEKVDLAFSNGKKVVVDLKPLGYRFLRLGKSDSASGK